ncbi:MAG: TetR/AcrR family transcriptional regulator [Hyphomicrobiales bacterium]
MRYKPGRREETRTKMLSAAGRGFRSHGYAGIGVDGLAKQAGVTSGAFYSHFGSKDAAFRAALAAGLDEVAGSLPVFQRDHGSRWVEAFVDYYLGNEHRDDLAGGCAMATLTPEVVRTQPDVQAAFEEKMTRIAEIVAAGLEGGGVKDRHARAWAMLSILIGALTLARAMNGEATATAIAEAAKAAALQAAGPVRAYV